MVGYRAGERGRPFEFLLGQPGRVVEGLDPILALPLAPAPLVPSDTSTL